MNRTRRITGWALALCLLTWHSGVLAADDESPATATSDATTLDAITIAATRNPIRSFIYPGMVSVVGRQKINNRQASTLDDVLRDVPNVEFTGGPRRNGQQPSIRGFDGSDVVVTLDGARQNTIAGHDGGLFVDPSLLREIEVMRGPASSLYGSGGTGGVISMRTVRASDFIDGGNKLGGQVAAGFNTVNNESHERLTLYGRPTDDLDWLASATKRDSSDIKLGDGSTLDNSGGDIASGLFKGGWSFGDGHRLEASFQHYDSETNEPSNGQGQGSGGLVDKRIRSNNWRLSYDYAPADNRWIDLTTTAYRTVTRIDKRRLDRKGQGPKGEQLGRKVTTDGLRLENASRFWGDDVTLTYGAEGYRNKQDGSTDHGQRGGVPDAKTEFGALFTQLEWRLQQPLGAPGEVLLMPGVRYDHYRSSTASATDNSDSAVSPRFGITYQPTEWAMLFANVADAFRAPTVNELYTTGEHFRIPGFGVNRFVSNPDLDPQRTTTIEYGFGLDFHDVLVARDEFQLKASRFEIEGDDFIDLQVDQPAPPACSPPNCNGTARSVNVADAQLSGYEVEAAYDSGPARLRLGFSTIDGENKRTGEPLGVLGPNQLTVDASWRFDDLDTRVGWHALVADEFDNTNDPDERRPGYTVHDVYASWQPTDGLLSNVRIDFGVNNVFDKAYSRVYTGSYEAGRDWRTRLTYEFD